MTANEKKQMRKNKRNARIARGRFIKNLFIWLLGVLFLPTILVLSLVVIPIGTFTGNDKENPIVSEEIASMAILPALLKIGEFGVSDLPFLEDLLKGLEETQVSESGTIGDLIEIDYGKLNTLKFGSETFSSDLTSCITVTATIDSVGGAGLFGDANIEAFSTFSEVASEDKPEIVDGYITKTEAGEFTSNPKLYYYNADELSGGGADPFTEDPEEDNANYERAFTDDGKLLIDESVTLYTVPLFKAPLLDAVDLIDEIFGRVEILELLTVFGVELPEEEGEEGIIQTLFEGKTVAELGAITVDDIYIYDILKGETDSQLYQILKQATGAETAEEITLGMLSSGLEINDVLISTFLTDTESDIFKILCDAVVVEGGELQPTAETLNIGHLSNIDIEKVDMSVVLPYKEYGENGELTTDNSELYKILLSAITEDGVSKLPERIDGESDADYDARVQEAAEALSIGGLSGINADNVLISTFITDTESDIFDILCDAVEVEQGKEKPSAETLTLGHLKNLNIKSVKMTAVLPYKEYNELGELVKDNSELYKMILSSLEVDGASRLPEKLDGETEEDYDARVKTEAEKLTVDELSSLKTNDILLSSVMPSPDDQLKEILETVIGKDYTEISVGELSNMDPDDISLSAFLTMPSATDDPLTEADETQTNKKLYDILLQSLNITDDLGEKITSPTASDIKLRHLGSFDTQGILLSSVMPKTDDNAKLYDILKEVTGKDYSAVTVGDLSTFEATDICLNTVMPKTDDNAKLYDILKEVTGKNYDEVTVGDLSTFETTDIFLNTVVPKTSNNERLYDVLFDLTGKAYNEVTVGNLTSFSTTDIHLTTVMPKDSSNAKLYEVLLESLTITDELGATITNPTEDDITISHLSSFSTDGIKLNTVMPYDAEKNAKLYGIIEDVTGQGYSSVTLSHMKEFDTGKIHISTVLEKGDNAIINAIIENGGSIGDMDTAISSLTLYEVYKDVCFTTDENKAVDNSQKYVLGEVDGKAVYTRSDSGTYFVSEDAGIWMIICFDGNATENENGRSTVYTENDMTLGDLLNSGNSLNSRIHGATIRELISVGIIKGVTFDNEAIYKMTFSEFLTAAAEALNKAYTQGS